MPHKPGKPILPLVTSVGDANAIPAIAGTPYSIIPYP